MLKIQSYFCTLLLLTALILFNSGVHAQDGVMPSKSFEGLWAAPDCRNWEELNYYTKYFIISHDLGDKTFKITPINTLLTQKEYSVISIDGRKVPTRVLEDGVLLQIDVESYANFSKTWDDLPAIRYHEYMHCFDTKLPKLLPELMELSVRLDNIYPNCQYSISNQCKEKLFAAYMPEHGKKISIKEIKNILEDIVIISKATGGSQLSKSELNDMAGLILSILDIDGSKDISLEELQNNKVFWNSVKLTGPAKHKLVAVLNALAVHFPSLDYKTQ